MVLMVKNTLDIQNGQILKNLPMHKFTYSKNDILKNTLILKINVTIAITIKSQASNKITAWL